MTTSLGKISRIIGGQYDTKQVGGKFYRNNYITYKQNYLIGY